MNKFVPTAVCRWAVFAGMVICQSSTGAIDVFGDEPVRAIRRVLVPAEEPEKWPRDGQGLLPVEARDFEGWLTDANAPASSASIVAAEYQARWDEAALEGTRGSWEVQRQGNRAASLALGDSTIAIRSPVWRNNRNTAARLGWWPDAENDGFVRALAVPASGVVDFEWDLPEPTSDSHARHFLLELPTSARTQLVLDLPRGKRPVVERGTVVESPEFSTESTNAASQRGRWVLALATGRPQLLAIEDVDGSEIAKKTTVVRQSVRYRLHRGGLDLEARLQLSADQPLPKSIVVTLPSGMSLISVEAEGQPLASRATARQVTIELPDAARGPVAVVALRAWGPLALGELQRLPILSLSESFWAAGELELIVDDSLELCSVTPADCVQTAAAGNETGPLPSRRLSFAAYAPGAAIDIAVRHRQSVGAVQSVTSLVLGNPDVVGKVNSLVGVERGRLHRLTAELRSGWTLDAVETTPVDALAEWYVDRTAEPQLLCLQLDRAIVPGEPLKIHATVHAGAAATDSVPVAELIPLEWQLHSATKLLELRPAEQYDLEVHGELRELSVDQVSAEQQELLTGDPGGRLAVVGEGSQATIRRVAKRIDYDATVEIEAALVDDRCDVSYEITCIPRGGGIDHALLFLSEAVSEPIQWIDADSKRVLNVAKMPATDPRRGGLPVDGELCRLDFGRLYARPIRILARQSISWDARQAVPLVSLPDAASQQGRVTVSSSGRALPEITVHNMSPAPFPWHSRSSSPTNSRAVTRAVYRFQPTRFYDSASPPQLWVAHGASNSSPRLIATQIDLESRYTLDGQGVHHAVYHLNNQGATSFTISPAEDTILTAAQVDGAAVQIRSQGQVSLPLPQRNRAAVVKIQLKSRGAPLANGIPLRLPLPATDSAHLTGEWRVRLPHGFAAADPTADAHASGGDWRTRMFGPLARRSDRPFNPLDLGDWNRMWIAASSRATPAAQAASEVSPAAAEPPMPDGMATYRFVFGSSPLSRVVVSHWRSTSAVALAICLLTAVGAQLLGLRLRTRLGFALATAAASLLIPAEWAPLATGATLGLVAAALWHWIQPAARVRATATALFAALLAPMVASAAPDGPVIESFLVPVDAAGNPAGTKYFVTDKLLRQLLAQANAASESERWLCTDMRCEGQLTPTADRKGLAVGDWRLTLECEVFARDVNLSLPLVQSEADWQPVALVDGMPVPVVWESARRSCSIRIAEPGPRQISLTFQPRSPATGSRRTASIQLPQINSARVSITAPPRAGEVRSDDTLLARNDQPQQTTWQGPLAADGRFSLSWPNDLVDSVGAAQRQVAQVSRLNVSPSGLRLELQLIQRSSDPWPESIQVAVEEGWQLAPNQQWQIESTETLNDGRKLLVLPTPSTARDELHLSLRFDAPDRSPLGQIRPPVIELESLPLHMRWMTVACDPQLECLPSQPTSEPLNVAPGLSPIVESIEERRPTVVVNLDQIRPDWHLAVRPAAVQSTIRSRLSMAAGVDRMRIHFRCDVNPRGADRFRHTLSVPDELSIESITAIERGEPLALEWNRVDPGGVNVFFDRAATDSYRIELQGSLPMPDDGICSVPRIAPLAKLDSSQTIALYREDNVAAEWRFPAEPPWVEGGASLTNPFDSDTHFVRAFPADDVAAPDVRVVVARDDPALAGDALTQVRRSKTSWEAIWSCRLRVERGTFDVLRLKVPETWSGPFDVTPSATSQLAAPANPGQEATLTVRLLQRVQAGEEIRLNIRSPLVMPEGQPVSAPCICLLAEGRQRDFLMLPTQLEGESLSWTRSGVEATELPSDFPEPDVMETSQCYQITNDRIDVALRPRPPRTDLAVVRLAETVTFTGDESDLHATRFLLSPAGLDQCDLHVSDALAIVRVSVNGHPALMHQLDPSLVQVQLDHPNLPQVLDVVIQSQTTPGRSNRVTLNPPTLEQTGRAIPVDLQLWTIRGRPAGLQPRPEGCTSVSPARLAAMRVDWMANISQSATRTALEVPAVDGYSWFLHWASALRTAGRHAESFSQTLSEAPAPTRVSPAPANSSAEVSGQAEIWIDQMAEFFQASELTWSSDGPSVDEVLAMGTTSIGGGEDVQCFVSEGGRDWLAVEFPAQEWTAVQTRYFALGSLALVAMIAVWASGRRQFRSFAENWPEVWGLAIGAAAWAWLRPSVVGLLIAAVSAVFLLRRIQLREKSPRHDSSKLPISNPDELA